MKIPACTTFSLMTRLVCLCLAGGLGRASAAPVALSIPGAVTVTIEPAEAVAAGAQWSIDGGALHASGEIVTNLAAGSHTVQFKDLAAWLEPDAVSALVIGGKQASVIATYRALPQYYFRSTPEQRVLAGKTLELLVTTDDPSDPQNPGPGTTLQMTAAPPPAGALAFDLATGHLSYTPSAADRLPFSIRLTTPQGLSGTFEVTPLNTPTAEESVITYDRPLPDPESRDYMQISEVPNDPELFNDASNKTFTVSISGHTLVFETNHPANLLRQYNGRLDVREMRLYADRVIVRSPLLLPETAIFIHARELRFENDGRIDTTPRARARRPDGAVWGDDLFVGRDGDPGHPGGNVEVLVERFYSDNATATRFVLHGGDGGPAGDGRDGQAEGSLGFLSQDWFKLMSRAGNPYCGSTENSSVIIESEEFFRGSLQESCGERVTARGENAVPSGKPGTGGPGGTLRATLNLGGYASFTGGSAGAKGNDHVGGTLTARAFVYRTTSTIVKPGGQQITTTDEENAPKAPGNNAAAPGGTSGATGSFTFEPNPAVWLHSFAVRSFVQYAKDAYLNDRISEARQMLGEYQQLLRAHQRVVGSNDQLSDDEFSEFVNIDQLTTEVENLIYRLDSNLDYFGNPAGWVPMLSFEANFLAFQNEVDQSIPILYLAYWLNNAATNLQASLAATEQVKSNLETERSRMETEFNDAQTAIPRLKSEAETIDFQIGILQGQITNKLTQLEQRARDNVAEANKVPFWKKALGVLSVAADLVPVGQPIVGRIGAGLELLTKVDPNKPLESAKALAPQAMNVMTNIDISVCFGSNAPPITSTNTAGGTNNTKKASQDILKAYTGCAKFLGGELSQLGDVFKDAQVDDKQLATELDKLKASDTELHDLENQLTALNVQKATFAKELTAALQTIGSFSAGLSQNLVATHELEDRIGANLNVLDHGALMQIKEMQRRAQDRLVMYQYLLAKSFQYRQLKPFTGNLQLTSLFTKFQQLVEASSSHVLSQQDFETLKGIFVDQLRDIVAQSLDNANAPSRSFPKSFRLNASQLQQLNQQGQLVLNLKDIGLIDAGDDNVRLADLRTLTLTAHPVGPIGSLATVRINYQHQGISRLTSGGRTFLFRHYQTEAVNPIVWNAVYDANTGQTVNSTLTAAQQSLISVLLALQPIPVTNLVFYSQPAANADILITKDVSTDNGTDFIIDNLLFQIQYDFAPTSGNLKGLDVRVSDNLTPVVTLSQADINSRQDGQGNFSRVFPPFTVVTLQAPGTYGQYVFDRWFVNNQPQTAQVPVLAVFLAGDTQVQAQYRLPAGPLVLTPIPVPPGQIGFAFPSQTGVNYTIEQTQGLTHPTWTTVDTRVGDGTILQFTRPINAGPATFFRVRQGP
jgi:hypothetical protein